MSGRTATGALTIFLLYVALAAGACRTTGATANDSATAASVSDAAVPPPVPSANTLPVPALPPAKTNYVNNGTNNGIIGPNGTIINTTRPARRLLGRTIAAPWVQRLQSRVVPELHISACNADAETDQLAEDFWNASVQLRWDVRSKPDRCITAPDLARHGVEIDSTAPSSDGSDPLRALTEWLVSIGIPADYHPGLGRNEIKAYPQ